MRYILGYAISVLQTRFTLALFFYISFHTLIDQSQVEIAHLHRLPYQMVTSKKYINLTSWPIRNLIQRKHTKTEAGQPGFSKAKHNTLKNVPSNCRKLHDRVIRS